MQEADAFSDAAGRGVRHAKTIDPDGPGGCLLQGIHHGLSQFLIVSAMPAIISSETGKPRTMSLDRIQFDPT